MFVISESVPQSVRMKEHARWGEACLMLQHHIRQGLNTLGSDFTLFVVDLLGLFVAEQEYDCAKQEDGGAPAHAVRPPKLPHLSVACNMNTKFVKCGRIIIYTLRVNSNGCHHTFHGKLNNKNNS